MVSTLGYQKNIEWMEFQKNIFHHREKVSSDLKKNGAEVVDITLRTLNMQYPLFLSDFDET